MASRTCAPPRALRIGHYGTGQTGSVALRQVLARPEFELVSHLVHTPAKVGRDSGELVGCAPAGVTTIADFGEFLETPADCVTYFATEFGRNAEQVVDEISQLLRSGKNVVTTAFTQLVYPESLPEPLYTALQNACLTGDSSFFGTGIGPGFTSDALVASCTSTCERVRSVKVSERVLRGTYSDPVVFEAMGFGRTPDHDAQCYRPGPFLAKFSAMVRLIADSVGIELDDIREGRDIAVVDRDYQFGAGRVAKGTIGGVRFRVEGVLGGQPVVTIARISSLTDEVIDDWDPYVPQGSPVRRATRIEIDGDPCLQVQFDMSGDDMPGVRSTAARAVNAIPVLCAAAPGVYSALTLPAYGLNSVRSIHRPRDTPSVTREVEHHVF